MAEATVVDHGDSIGERHRFLLIVRHVERGDGVAGLEQPDLCAHHPPIGRVHPREWFLEQEDGRTADKCSRPLNELLAPGGKLIRHPLEEAINRQPATLGKNSPIDFIVIDVVNFEGEGDIAPYRPALDQRIVLEDHRDVRVLPASHRSCSCRQTERHRRRDVRALRRVAEATSCRSPTAR